MFARSRLLLLAALCVCGSLRAGTVQDTNFVESTFLAASGDTSSITSLAWAPDGRLFFTRKDGQVRIVKAGTLLPAPFATLSAFTASECGLLGICFDPDFVNNRFVYVFVTVSSSEQQIIRFTDANDVGTAQTVLIPGLPTVGANHDGGGLGIGADGKLYFSIGDLGNGTGVDADLTTLASKVGRANLDGTPVADNPFNDGAGPNNDYIWARGFRNPFALTFQPGTGKLWVSVAGTSYEQIFQVSASDHAGWNDFENNQPSGFLAPAIKYRTNSSDTRNITTATRSSNIATFTTATAHGFRKGERLTISGVSPGDFKGAFFVSSVPSATTFTVAQNGSDATGSGGTAATANLGGAVTGCTFYEGTAFPAEYRGNFFFCDFNSGNVVRATIDANNSVGSVRPFVTGVSQATDVVTGPDGALYYSSFAGDIFRLATTSVPVPNTLPLIITKITGKVNFSRSDADSLQLSGVIPNVPALDLNDMSITFNVGGVTQSFSIEDDGQDRGRDESLKLTYKRTRGASKSFFAGGDLKFSMRVIEGNFSSAWADEGISSGQTVRNAQIPFVVTIAFNGQTYGATVTTSYTARAGRSGRFTASFRR